MKTKITIIIEGTTPEYHNGIVNTIIFTAKPFAGKWTAEITREELEDVDG